MREELNDYTKTLVNAYDMSQDTKNAYYSRINDFFNYVEGKGIKNIKEISLSTMEDYLSYLTQVGNSASTKSNKITAINSYFNYLLAHDKVEFNPCANLKSIKVPMKIQTYLTVEESLDMINNCKNKRTKAIVALCLQCGLRSSEIVNLQVSDVYEEREKWIVLVRDGKGKKDRLLYLDNDTKNIIFDYLEVRKDSDLNNLFISDQKTAMNPNSINRTLKNVAKVCGIDKNVTVHTLRRSLATRLNDAGHPVTYIQKVLGHNHYTTTLRYIYTNDDKIYDMVSTSTVFNLS